MSKRTLQRCALFLAMPLSLLATIPFSRYTVEQLRTAALQQERLLTGSQAREAHGKITHRLLELSILPFSARKKGD